MHVSISLTGDMLTKVGHQAGRVPIQASGQATDLATQALHRLHRKGFPYPQLWRPSYRKLLTRRIYRRRLRARKKFTLFQSLVNTKLVCVIPSSRHPLVSRQRSRGPRVPVRRTQVLLTTFFLDKVVTVRHPVSATAHLHHHQATSPGV